MTRFLVPLTLLAVLLTGCAMPAAQPSASSADRLQPQLDVHDRQLSLMQTRLDGMEQKLAGQQEEIADLRRELAAQKVTRHGENTIPAGVSQTSPAADAAATPPASPTETYLEAFGDYASGRFEQAITGFETFLDYFPANNYAGNAQFWLGECYFHLEKYDRAVREFQKVVDNYPLSGKAPNALLRMAPALRKLNQFEQARQALQSLQQRYPNSTAAQKALTGQ
jgi:tol-pal system protein YbgF